MPIAHYTTGSASLILVISQLAFIVVVLLVSIVFSCIVIGLTVFKLNLVYNL